MQGDTGHAQASMVTERYAHILDDDRRLNAERFQKEFYTAPKSTPEKEPEAPSAVPPLALGEKERNALLLSLLAGSPEMAGVLKTLAQAL